jgi:hypothetical protein
MVTTSLWNLSIEYFPLIKHCFYSYAFSLDPREVEVGAVQ